MPALKNARHELFATLIAAGKSQRCAALECGYADDDSNASRLAQDDRISTRVAELRKQAGERSVLTLEAVTAKLIDIHDRALAMKASPATLNVARQAIMDVAKINGLIVDRVESDNRTTVISSEPLSAEQWQQQYTKGMH